MTKIATDMSLPIILLALLFVGAGCAEPLTNDQIIAEARKCDEAGLGFMRVPQTGRPVDIVCAGKPLNP